MIVCETSEKPLMVLHLLHHLKVRSALCFTKSVESAHRLYKLIQLYEKIRTTAPPPTSGSKGGSETSSAGNEKKAKSGNESENEDGNESDSNDDSNSSSSGSSSEDESEEEEEEEEEEEAEDQDDVEMEDVEPTVVSTGSDPANTDIEMAPSPVADSIVVAEYSSDLPNSKRQAILRAFNKGEIHLLICSDLISRGMDLAPVSVVINYDTPVYMKKYIHRVGRTARAGKTGTAYSLVETQEARHFKEMVSKAGHWEKISRIKVKDQEVKDLVPQYTRALAGLKEELTASARAHKMIGGRRIQRS